MASCIIVPSVCNKGHIDGYCGDGNYSLPAQKNQTLPIIYSKMYFYHGEYIQNNRCYEHLTRL